MKAVRKRLKSGTRGAAWFLITLLCLAGCRLDGGTQTAGVRPVENASPQSGSSTTQPVAEIFRPVLSQLKSETGVPVLLPGELPPALSEGKVYVDSLGKTDGYSITLTSRPNCGANACTIGYFEAKRGEKPSLERKVKLARGVEGFYQPLTCGGSCTPPTVEWLSDGVLYSIQLDVAGKETLGEDEEERRLIRVADSAINAGPR